MKTAERSIWDGIRGSILHVLALGCLVTLTGCGRSSDKESSASTASQTPVPPPAPAPPAPPKPPPTLRLTQEMDAAAVRVVVTIAATLQKEYGGVILNREAVNPPLPPTSTHRVVAACIPDYQEKDLLDKSCTVRVQRNRLDAQGNPCSQLMPAMVAHFDPASHELILLCADRFPYSLEPGYLPAKDHSAVFALATRYMGPIPPADSAAPEMTPPKRSYNRSRTEAPYSPRKRANPRLQDQAYVPSFGAMASTVTLANLKDQALTFSGVNNLVDEQLLSLPVLGVDGGLAGFAVRSQTSEWSFSPYTTAELKFQPVHYVPQSLALDDKRSGLALFDLQGSLYDPLKETSFRIVVRLAAKPDFTPPASPEADQPALDSSQTVEPIFYADGSLGFSLDLPKNAENSHTLIQVQLLNADGAVVFHAAPFMVSLPAIESGDPPVIRGLIFEKTSSVGSPHSPFVFKRLATESKILWGTPIREGRELLVRLDGAPYWKRLSLEKREWLPLPKVDLATARITGNKDTIFVLEPEQHKVTRFNAVTLAEEKSQIMPEALPLRDVVAGNFSSLAPLALIEENNVLACDAHELAIISAPETMIQLNRQLRNDMYFIAAGDGSMLHSYPINGVSGNLLTYIMKYQGQPLGFSRPKSNDYNQARFMTVSADYVFAGQGFQPGGTMIFPSPSEGVTRTQSPLEESRGRYPIIHRPFSTSPVSYALQSVTSDADAPHTSKCHFQSCFGSDIFFAFELPELEVMPPELMESTGRERMWFDPYSFSVALWHEERSIIVRTFDRSKMTPPASPVLLNFPETIIPRGGVFQFSPLLFGPAGSSLTAISPPEGFETDKQGVMKWKVPEKFLPESFSLKMRLASKAVDEGHVEFSIPLTIDGVRPAVATPASMDPVAAFASMHNAEKGKLPPSLQPLDSHLVMLGRPVQAVLPGLDDYLALKMQDDSILLYSLKDWKIAGSLTLPATSAVFPAGNVLFTYDPASRTLARHQLPDLAITGRASVPDGGRLTALAVGEAAEGPVTLFLSEREASDSIQAESFKTLILDKHTLDTGKWASLTLPKGNSVSPPREDMELRSPRRRSPPMSEHPILRIPCSRDGQLLCLPYAKIVVTPTVSMVCPLEGSPDLFFLEEGQTSFVGDRFYDGVNLYMGGKSASPSNQEMHGFMSRGGNYIVTRETVQRAANSPYAVYADEQNPRYAVLHSTDGFRPLLNVVNIAAFDTVEGGTVYRPQPLIPLENQNFLVALNADSTVLEIIRLDLPGAFKQIVPDSLVVTSQPMPLVAGGKKFEYQITVNNPDAVREYRLRDNLPGASIDAKGHFTYSAPSGNHESKTFLISVEIHLKNDQIVMHEFPIVVLPS